MLVADTVGGLDALGENGFGVVSTIVLRESLRVHLIAGNIVGIGGKQRSKMGLGSGKVSRVGAFDGHTVKSEGVSWILGEQFLELLATGFLLFGHGDVLYVEEERS